MKIFQKNFEVGMSSMTKEELKNALISHGAPVPPASAKKDEFIQVSRLLHQKLNLIVYSLMTHEHYGAIRMIWDDSDSGLHSWLQTVYATLACLSHFSIF